jgi:hypothetical protein
MKNTLAENLLRFGVKNFTHENLYRVSQLLKEQFALPAAPAFNFAKIRANADFAAAENVVKNFMARQKVLTTIPDAAFLLTIAMMPNNGSGFFQKTMLKNPDKAFDAMQKGNWNILEIAKEIGSNEKIIQFNESPNEPGKIFMKGTMTATSYAASDVAEGAATIQDIISYMNNYNILAGANGSVTTGWDVDYGPAANDISDFAMEYNNMKPKMPGYGAWLPDESSNSATSYVYGLVSFKAASSKTTAGTKTEVTYTPGPELGSNLGPQLFETGTITPAPTLAERVKQAVEDAKSLGTIVGARIISGASFDRPVEGSREMFANKVGMPVDKVPMDPKTDQEGEVKDPMSGGNAFLAYYRGIAIKNVLDNLGLGVTPTIEAIVAKGGDAAQYAKIMFSVKKADETTSITTDDIKSIGTKSASNELSGKFQCAKFSW